RARGDHPDHLPRKETFIWLVAYLLTDGDVVAFLDQSAQVIIDRMERDACHGHAHTLGNWSGGEHNIQRASWLASVIIEGFIKIAQPKKHDRIRIFLFDFQVLLS